MHDEPTPQTTLFVNEVGAARFALWAMNCRWHGAPGILGGFALGALAWWLA
jgi:hypothetical protein